MNGLVALTLALTAGLNCLLVVSVIPFVKEEYKNSSLIIWLISIGLFVVASFYLSSLYLFAPHYFNSPNLLTILGIFFLVVSYSGAICFFPYLSRAVEWKTIWQVSFVIITINIALVLIALWMPPELRIMAPSFWVIILSTWLLYQLSSSNYPKGEYLIYALKILALSTLLPALLWIGLVLNFYHSSISFLTKEELSQWGDVIRVIRNLSAPISFFMMFIYWLKYDSIFAIRAKEDRNAVETLLQEKDQLIYELSKANSLASAGALAGGLAHELNQYLARIQINADVAFDQAANNPDYEVFKNPLKRILEANTDAAGMISALRATFTLRNEAEIRIEISQSVRDVVNLFRSRMMKSKIELQLDDSDSIGFISWGAQLTIVLSNLLLNAIEALDANSNPKKIIAITYEITDECVLIKLFDNGSSIHPSKASKLFTLFSTTKTQGLGVGLWLSKFIMEKQGGDLSFANGNQGGVEFTLTIPKKLLVKQ